jgi:hypothetical protein
MNLKSFICKGVFFSLLAATGLLQAQTFNYNPDDLLICFRNTNSAVNDLVVDAGPVSTFTNLSVGQKITVTQFTGQQLASVGTNSLAWSAFACDNNSPVDENLWMTRPRSDYNTQTTPWTAGNLFAQGPAASKIDSVGNDALTIGSGLPASANNTPTALVEAESGHKQQDNGCYAFYIGSLGNFGGSFQGNIEQNTANNFTTGGQNVRADFYQLLSTNTSGPGKYLGYFEFYTNGVLIYTAGPAPTVVTAAVITKIVRVGTTNTIMFTCSSGGTYTLRGTNVLTVARTNWPAITSTNGNGSTQTMTDVTPSSSKFYTISAQ